MHVCFAGHWLWGKKVDTSCFLWPWWKNWTAFTRVVSISILQACVCAIWALRSKACWAAGPKSRPGVTGRERSVLLHASDTGACESHTWRRAIFKMDISLLSSVVTMSPSWPRNSRVWRHALLRPCVQASTTVDWSYCDRASHGLVRRHNQAVLIRFFHGGQGLAVARQVGRRLEVWPTLLELCNAWQWWWN